MALTDGTAPAVRSVEYLGPYLDMVVETRQIPRLSEGPTQAVFRHPRKPIGFSSPRPFEVWWGSPSVRCPLKMPFPRLKTTVRFEYHALPEQRLRFLNWAEPLE